jgi:hypothetical protein
VQVRSPRCTPRLVGHPFLEQSVEVALRLEQAVLQLAPVAAPEVGAPVLLA